MLLAWVTVFVLILSRIPEWPLRYTITLVILALVVLALILPRNREERKQVRRWGPVFK